MKRIGSALLLVLVLVLAVACLAPTLGADDASDAARIAGHLRSPDPLVRLKGESLLLERLRAGGDLAGFLRRLADALAPTLAPAPTPPVPPTPVVPPARAEPTVVVYDVRDLPASEVERALREAAPGAVIRGIQTHGWSVRATSEEHVRIREALERLRAASGPAPATPSPVVVPPAAGRHVLVEMEVFRVPAGEVAALLEDARARVRELDEATARVVEDRLAKTPDVRRLAMPRVAALPSSEATIFVGDEVEYRKDVRRDAGGGWSIVKGRIGTGTRIALTPALSADRLRFPLTYSVTSVAKPIPTVRTRPAPDAAEIEIDTPQWTTVSATVDVDLPAQGGRALLHLPGLSGDSKTALVVLLRATVLAN